MPRPLICSTPFFLSRRTHTTGESPHDLAAAINRQTVIEGNIADTDAVFAGILHQLQNFGISQQRLAWNAAPVQAHSTNVIVLDNRSAQTKLRCANRRDIAARTRANNNHIIICQSNTSKRRASFTLSYRLRDHAKTCFCVFYQEPILH
ncbi:hypothetical protein GBAR_LOCUS19150 [Geodia barretti]|uniref:Uncharacterized protein n=1 Tax=Geodia barretti TaxID=519541 RepID=A0AA35SPQ1_GEOBA|nr:hypothetical protein GBAR_LOCUS19150 [Geodia barretti]